LTNALRCCKLRKTTLFIIFILVGILDSAYLFISSCFAGSGSGVCPAGGSCCSAEKAFYSLLGLLWFTAGMAFIFQPRVIRARLGSLSFAWSLLGVVGVAYFVALEFYTHNFCPFCTIAHISGLGAVFTLNQPTCEVQGGV